MEYFLKGEVQANNLLIGHMQFLHEIHSAEDLCSRVDSRSSGQKSPSFVIPEDSSPCSSKPTIGVRQMDPVHTFKHNFY
jgi:hypothetical protein